MHHKITHHSITTPILFKQNMFFTTLDDYNNDFVKIRQIINLFESAECQTNTYLHLCILEALHPKAEKYGSHVQDTSHGPPAPCYG